MWSKGSQRRKKGGVWIFLQNVASSSCFWPTWIRLLPDKSLYLDIFWWLNPVHNLMWFSWSNGWLGSGVAMHAQDTVSPYWGRKVKVGLQTMLLESKMRFPRILQLRGSSQTALLILCGLEAVSWPSKAGHKLAVCTETWPEKSTRLRYCYSFK